MKDSRHIRGSRIALCMAWALLLAPLPSLATDPSATDPPADDPQQVVTVALDEIMTVLNDVDASEANRRDRIADIAFAHFDFSTMSKLVVARPWRKFTPDQRTEFVAAFKTHLARSYGRRLARYEGTKVAVVGRQDEQRGDVTVLSKVVGGQFDGATLDYRMRGATGTWLVIDVAIEGVSLVSNFRSQFKPILAQGGAAELLKRLKDKNGELHAAIQLEEQQAEFSAKADSN
jgi:phospholipid transport system substrate-binding protein